MRLVLIPFILFLLLASSTSLLAQEEEVRDAEPIEEATETDEETPPQPHFWEVPKLSASRPAILLDLEDVPDAAGLDRRTLDGIGRLGDDIPQDTHYSLANLLYLDERYRLALEEYEFYLTNRVDGRNRAEAMFRMAECYRHLNDWPKARAELLAIRKAYPGTWMAKAAAFQLALLSVDGGSVDIGITQLKLTLEEQGLPDELVQSGEYLVARLYEKVGNYPRADEWYGKILEREGGTYEESAIAARARMAEERGDPESALKFYRQLLEKTDSPLVRAEVELRLGEYAMAKGQRAEAVQHWMRAFRMPVEGTKSRQELQHAVLERLGELPPGEAIDAIKPLVSDLPDWVLPDALLLLARKHQDLGESDQAVAYLQHVQEKWAGQPAGWEAEIALLWFSREDEELLRERLEQLKEEDLPPPQVAMLTLFRGQRAVGTGQWKTALKRLKSIDREELPERYRAGEEVMRLWCQWKLEKWEEVVKGATAFVEEHPGHRRTPFVLVVRALALAKVGRYGPASHDLEVVLKGWPAASERAFAIQQAAMLAGQQGEDKGMADYFRMLLREFPDSSAVPQAHFFLGRHAVMQGQPQEGLEHLEMARSLDPCSLESEVRPWLWTALHRLESWVELTEEIERDSFVVPMAQLNESMLLQLGEYWLRENDARRALSLLEMAWKSAESPAAALLLARAQVELERWEEAEQSLLRLQEMEEGTLPVPQLLLLGSIQQNLGKWDEARENYRRVEEVQDPWNAARGSLGVGRVMIAEGRPEEALDHLLDLLERYEDVRLTPRILTHALQAARAAGNQKEADRIWLWLRRDYPDQLPRQLPPPPGPISEPKQAAAGR